MRKYEPKLSRDILDVIKYYQPTRSDPLNSWKIYHLLREERGDRVKSSKELSSYIKKYFKDYKVDVPTYTLGILGEFTRKDVPHIIKVEKIDGRVCIYLEPVDAGQA